MHLLRYDEEMNEIITELIYNHRLGEIWCLSPCPKSKELVVTCGGSEDDTFLWKLEGIDCLDDVKQHYYDDSYDVGGSTGTAGTGNGNANKEMKQLCKLESSSRNVAVEWKPSEKEEGGLELATLSRDKLYHWDIEQEVLLGSAALPVYNHGAVAAGLCWDPHSPSSLACTYDRNIAIFDTRSLQSGKPHITLNGVHRHTMTSIDYNPNRPHILVSSSEDSTLKFHDIRNPSIPLKICRGGHSHWVTHVKYNPFHDQLLLSAGTDSLVNLWRMSSISSAPLLELQPHMEEHDDPNTNHTTSHNVNTSADYDSKPDLRVMKFEGQDSVYAAA